MYISHLIFIQTIRYSAYTPPYFLFFVTFFNFFFNSEISYSTIYLRRFNALVPKDLLHCCDVNPSVQQQRGTGMTGRVKGDIFLYTCLFSNNLQMSIGLLVITQMEQDTS